MAHYTISQETTRIYKNSYLVPEIIKYPFIGRKELEKRIWNLRQLEKILSEENGHNRVI